MRDRQGAGQLQPLVLSGLRNELMTPEAVERFRNQYLDWLSNEWTDLEVEQASLQKAIAKEQKAIDGAMRAIRDDMATKSVYAMLRAAEEKKETLEADLAGLEAPALDIPADLAALYRARVDALADTLSDPEVVHRASEILGGLIDCIVIRHDETDGHTAEIEGDLAGILSLCQTSEKAAGFSPDGLMQIKLVAGVGFEPTTFRL